MQSKESKLRYYRLSQEIHDRIHEMIRERHIDINSLFEYFIELADNENTKTNSEISFDAEIDNLKELNLKLETKMNGLENYLKIVKNDYDLIYNKLNSLEMKK